jgi:hypothetical protein
MIEQKKKLRLDDLQVESFVTTNNDGLLVGGIQAGPTNNGNEYCSQDQSNLMGCDGTGFLCEAYSELNDAGCRQQLSVTGIRYCDCPSGLIICGGESYACH